MHRQVFGQVNVLPRLLIDMHKLVLLFPGIILHQKGPKRVILSQP